MLQNIPSAQTLGCASQQPWDLGSGWVGVLGCTSILPHSGRTIDCRAGNYVQYGQT